MVADALAFRTVRAMNRVIKHDSGIVNVVGLEAAVIKLASVVAAMEQLEVRGESFALVVSPCTACGGATQRVGSGR
jgi:hypothetical protein